MGVAPLPLHVDFPLEVPERACHDQLVIAPDQFRLHLRKEVRVIQSPAYVVGHGISPVLASPRSFRCRIAILYCLGVPYR